MNFHLYMNLNRLAPVHWRRIHSIRGDLTPRIVPEGTPGPRQQQEFSGAKKGKSQPILLVDIHSALTQLFNLVSGLNYLIQPLFSLLQELSHVTQALFTGYGHKSADYGLHVRSSLELINIRLNWTFTCTTNRQTLILSLKHTWLHISNFIFLVTGKLITHTIQLTVAQRYYLKHHLSTTHYIYLTYNLQPLHCIQNTMPLPLQHYSVHRDTCVSLAASGGVLLQ